MSNSHFREMAAGSFEHGDRFSPPFSGGIKNLSPYPETGWDNGRVPVSRYRISPGRKVAIPGMMIIRTAMNR